VRDNGIGLAPESMGTIFELFAQVRATPRGKASGSA
jgi:signal transduction histidine kinase